MTESPTSAAAAWQLADHPLRQELVAEIHARPSPALSAPATALFLALRPERRSLRDRAGEERQLVLLAEAWGLPAPPAGVTQWVATRGTGASAVTLTFESHTEFVSLLLRADAGAGDPAASLPAGWIAGFPGRRMAAARFTVLPAESDAKIEAELERFTSESLAVARILDDNLVIAGDFRLDAAGEMQFAVYVRDGTGPRRVGRVVQRICEIETYRAMAMLGFARAREIGTELSELEGRLSTEIAGLERDAADADASLHALLAISVRLEQIETRANFRFAATAAYEQIVLQRIAVLREQRFAGRQNFGEFMSRRFDPAMRTVSATARRLGALQMRAGRGAELLRTKVEVARSAQNKALLESMDRRSDQALRLQHTVEGLSVVAIGYYAVGLTLYVLAPFAEEAHLSKLWLGALVTPLVVAGSWLMLRRIRRRLH